MLFLKQQKLNINYLCAPNNEASIGAIENYVVRNGGRKVGVIPNHGPLKDDEYTDLLYFAIDREDYFDSNSD